MKVSLFTIVVLNFSFNFAYAGDFTNLKVNYTTLEKQYPSSNQVVILRQKSTPPSSGSIHTKALAVPTEVDIPLEDSPLYERVMGYMEKHHQSIGESQSANVLTRRRDFNMGTKNESGFTWQKPVGFISVIADRQVVKENDNWVVKDQLILTVNAETFLKNLESTGIVKNSPSELSAFAGLNFNRRYIYSHYAKNYEEGIKSNFTKLFLSPYYFHKADIFEMDLGDSITKEDYFSFHFGAATNIPLQYGLNLSAAVLGGVEHLSHVNFSLEMKDKRDPSSIGLNLVFSKENTKFTQGNVTLQYDFLKILKLTILQFEYKYSSTKKVSAIYNIGYSDLRKFKKGNPEHSTLIKLINFNKDYETHLIEYLDHYEFSKSVEKSRDFSFLFWSSHKSTTQEEIILRTADEDKYYLNYNSYKSSNSKTLKGGILGTISLSILGFDYLKEYKKNESHEFNLYYQREYENSESHSNLEHGYYVKRTTGSKYQDYKKYVVNKLMKSGFVEGSLLQDIVKDRVRGPMQIYVSYKFKPEAITYLSQRSTGFLEEHFKKLCKFTRYPRSHGKNRARETRHRIAWACWREFKGNISLIRKHGPDRVKAFKNIIAKLYGKEYSLSQLETLLGSGNVTPEGSIKAKTYKGEPYTLYF